VDTLTEGVFINNIVRTSKHKHEIEVLFVLINKIQLSFELVNQDGRGF
jgi:hypothetical protein